MHYHRASERCVRGGRGDWSEGEWARRRHGGGWGGRHRAGRMFDQGDLRFVVLALLAEQDRHGYELIKEIDSRSGGAYAPSPGVIYPLLTMLEEMGLASLEATDGAKKLYAITDAGRAELAANRIAAEHLLARMASVRESNSSGRAPQIVRAVENFRFALRLRLERGPLTDEQITAVAATIDAAAAAIERS